MPCSKKTFLLAIALIFFTRSCAAQPRTMEQSTAGPNVGAGAENTALGRSSGKRLLVGIPTCKKPKTCKIAKSCDVPLSCDIAASCEVAKNCKVPRSCRIPKRCSVAKSCRIAKSCRVAKSCNIAKSCSVKSCNDDWWNPFCWFDTVTDAAKCGTKAVTDAATCGTRTISDISKCGARTVTDVAKCGSQTVTDIAKCGAQTVTDAAKCGMDTVADLAVCGGETITDIAKCGTTVVVDAVKCGTEKVSDIAKCGADTVTDSALCGIELVQNAADCLGEVVPDDIHGKLVNTISALSEGMQIAAGKVWDTVVDLSIKVFDKATDVAEGSVKTVKSHVAKADLEQSFDAIKNIGADLVTQVADKAKKLGDVAKKVGILAVGLTKYVADFFTGLFDCFSDRMCDLLLPNCDCTDGASFIKAQSEKVSLKCSAPVELTKGMSWNSEASSSKEKSLTTRPNAGKGRASKLDLQGGCTGSLDFSTDGGLTLLPVIEMTVDPSNGEVKLDLSGTVKAKLDIGVKAEGTCEATATWTFPQKPQSQTFCYGPACVVIFLQAIADARLKGLLAGAVSMGFEAEWGFSAKVTIAPSGDSDVSVSVGELQTKKGVQAAASMDFDLSLSVGPHLTVLPMPGVPIELLPMITAEVKGHGELEFDSDLTKPLSSDQVQGCASLALNIFAATQITGVGLSPRMLTFLDASQIKKVLCDEASRMATAMTTQALEHAETLAQCIAMPAEIRNSLSTVSDAVQKGVDQVSGLTCDAIGTLIPNFDLNVLKNYILFDDQHFCLTVAETHGAQKCGSVTCNGGVFSKDEMEMTGITVAALKPKIISETQTGTTVGVLRPERISGTQTEDETVRPEIISGTQKGNETISSAWCLASSPQALPMVIIIGALLS